MKNSPRNLSKSNRQLHIIEITVRTTSIYKLLDTAPVVDEVVALLHGVLYVDAVLALAVGGALAGRTAVASAHVAPQTHQAGHEQHHHHSQGQTHALQPEQQK